MNDERHNRLLQRGLDILEYLAANREPIGVRELAQALGMSPSTCYRLMIAFAERGYLQQDLESRRWSLGLKLLELGVTLLNGPGLPSLARSHLEALMHATNESVYLGVRDGDWVVYIDTILSQQALRTNVTLGSRWPLHATALGKVLLAALPDEEVEQVLNRDLNTLTSTTITDREILYKQIVETRERGYALNFGETIEGIFCAAAPVHDYTGTTVAAIGAAGPLVRIGEANIPQVIGLVTDTAHAISRQLGATKHV